MDRITKTSNERFTITFDFKNDLSSIDSLVSKSVTCVNVATGVDSSATIITSSAIANPKITVVLAAAGTSGDVHKITCNGSTTLGITFQKEVYLDINDKMYYDTFTKQPTDLFTVGANFSSELATGETITSKAVTSVNGATGASSTSTVIDVSGISSDALSILANMKAGIDGETHIIKFIATTSASNVYEKQVSMRVKEL